MKNTEGNSTRTDDESNMPQKLMVIFILGFIMIFAGTLVLVATDLFYGAGNSVGSSVFIFIWPFPIVLAAGHHAMWLVLLAMILTILSAVMFWVFRRENEKA